MTTTAEKTAEDLAAEAEAAAAAAQAAADAAAAEAGAAEAAAAAAEAAAEETPTGPGLSEMREVRTLMEELVTETRTINQRASEQSQTVQTLLVSNQELTRLLTEQVQKMSEQSPPPAP